MTRRSARTLRSYSTALILLLLAACGRSEASDDTLVHSSDAQLRMQVAELLPDIAERSGLELLSPVRVEWKSREELQRYVRDRLDQDLPEDEARRIVQSYALLGLVPEALDFRELLLSVYLEQVAGFYDPDSTALFIMDDQSSANVDAVLLHELVHALQDQHVDLDSLTARERGNDRRAAAHAALEGHATMVMLDYMSEELQGSPVDLSQIPNFAESSRPALEAMTDQYPVLAAAPRIIRESLLFPYVEGAGYVHALWREENARLAPLGGSMPRSTRQVLESGSIPDGGLVSPLDLAITAPEGSQVLYENDLGQLETGILLAELGVPEDVAAALRADRFILVATGNELGLLWASVWDDVAARQRFLDGLAPELHRFPFGATVGAAQIGGEPGVLLRAGSTGGEPVHVRSGPGRP